ncbi:hypothetical protein [Dyadobacter sp. 3J3]|uniref:hypothetical protein n=1 Tax=Dyadobacter sp. 3J3 TaxID=2606600 RepID=UPI0013588077|nr:hypothetical protein [Dyadobacter sp. 3J3]
MALIENLKQQLKDLLILNHGDIKITEYPNLVSDGRELDLNLGQLNQLIQQIYSDIDWRPYEIINTKLELVFRKGILSTDQFEEIISLVGNSVNRNVVEHYVVAELSKRGFKPREINHADPLSIQNKWMTDLVWDDYKESLIEVEWLGQKASSLSKLGTISFDNRDDAKYFLRNGNYLPGLVTALTKSASKADEFARIIEEEFDSEKRYLRTLYKLNPNLPFRFEDELFTDVSVLLQKACETSQGYQALLESYRKGILQIWIQEADPVVAANFSNQYDLNSFLRFLYKTDATLPFFIENHRFLSPDGLAEYAKKDFTIWPAIAESMAAKNIQEWFTGIRKDDWNDQISDSYAFLSHAGYYTEPEIRLAMVQALFHIINLLSDKPRLKLDQEKVQLLSVTGGVVLNHSVKISLKNEGYVKVKVYFKFIKEGILLSKDILEFNNLEGKITDKIDIVIDTFLLQKDQLYNLELVVSSVYEDIIIPVEINVVFPKKAYITKLVLYGFMTACYFGAFRFLLGIFLNYNGWLVDNSKIGSPDDVIGESPLLSFLVLALFVLGGLLSYKLVKKYEKI